MRGLPQQLPGKYWAHTELRAITEGLSLATPGTTDFPITGDPAIDGTTKAIDGLLNSE